MTRPLDDHQAVLLDQLLDAVLSIDGDITLATYDHLVEHRYAAAYGALDQQVCQTRSIARRLRRSLEHDMTKVAADA
jgi:hypothetical protein